jgi:hypothetical protein
VSAYVAVLASMYPGLSGRLLFDTLGVVAGFSHWPTLGMPVGLPNLVQFFRGSVSDDVVTADQWRGLAAEGITSRHALHARLRAANVPPGLAARLASHRERAWLLLGGIESRRNGQADKIAGDPHAAIAWYRDSIRLLERCGEKQEAAKSQVFLAGTMIGVPRQWTVLHGPGGASYLDPGFAQIDRLLREALQAVAGKSRPEIEGMAFSSLCALYQEHNDEKELREAVTFGERAVDLVGKDPRNEESCRAMLNLASALYALARITRPETPGWKSLLGLDGERRTAWLAQLARAERLASSCASDKYEDTIQFSEKAKDLLAKVRVLSGSVPR